MQCLCSRRAGAAARAPCPAELRSSIAQQCVRRVRPPRSSSRPGQELGYAPKDVLRNPGGSTGRADYEDDRPLHRLLQESRRELAIPDDAVQEDEEDEATRIAAAAVAAAALSSSGRAPSRGLLAPGAFPAPAAAAAVAPPAAGPTIAPPLGGGALSAPELFDSFDAGDADSAAGAALAGGCSDAGAGSDRAEDSALGPSSSGRQIGCPVFVMLPLDTVWVVERDGGKVAILKRERALEIALHTLRKAGVEGVMVDVWWGICERAGPRMYDFSAYRRLFHKCAAAGLKVQAVMSFHAAGGNVGDTCKIPLPRWVLEVGDSNPDIFYTDKQMHRNKECLSLGCDEMPLFWGRSPVDMYRDFIEAFSNAFDYLFGPVITEVTVGLGPAGELRYPSYPEGDGRWRFPGVGEFQCCDRYMMSDLRAAARDAGHPEWGHGGPHDAGHYNSRSWETGFFVSQGGSWQSEYGAFFLGWYSGLLVKHARRVLGAAASVLHAPGRPRVLRAVSEFEGGPVSYEYQPVVQLGAKLAGVHWWFKSRAHAAELTAGYYNTRDRDGYDPIIRVIAEFNGRLSFTCVEMRDCEHPPEGRCSPQGLLQQVLACTERHGVPLAGENALQRYDEHAFDRIAESAFGQTARAGRLEQLTFLRMGDLMFDNWDAFCAFLMRMRGGRGGGPASPQPSLLQQGLAQQQLLLRSQQVAMQRAQAAAAAAARSEAGAAVLQQQGGSTAAVVDQEAAAAAAAGAATTTTTSAADEALLDDDEEQQQQQQQDPQDDQQQQQLTQCFDAPPLPESGAAAAAAAASAAATSSSSAAAAAAASSTP